MFELSIKYAGEDIDVKIVRRPRKTLEIAVEPDMSVIVTAPSSASFQSVASKVNKRAGWIFKQRQYFAQFLPRTPDRRFISGETHLYLGRQYRLRIRKSTEPSVTLTRGVLWVRSKHPDRPDVTRALLAEWYRARAEMKFRERLEICMRRFANGSITQPKTLSVRQLRQRWGSMSAGGRLLLNARLVMAPVDAIDYVITHEICHTKIPHHGPRFFGFLTRVMPDWAARKSRLERCMA
jgi:predicted metal-dependent hydrolase